MTKKIYCTLDTETIGGATNPKGVYHLGGIIHDRKGGVFGCFNFIIAEWLNEALNDDYAKKNMDRYFEMLFEGTATLIPTEQMVVDIVEQILQYYNVGTMCAFNSGFDYEKTICRDFLIGRDFIDIWLMAVQTLAQRKKYAEWCAENGKVSKTNCCKTNAETMFGYLTDNPNYIEEHTALEDSKIELEIFNACIKSHLPFTQNCHFNNFDGKWEIMPRVVGE